MNVGGNDRGRNNRWKLGETGWKVEEEEER